MDAQVEILRKSHEDMEYLEDTAVKQLLSEPKLHKEKLLNEYRVARLLNEISSKATFALQLYQDEQGSILKEMEAVGSKNLDEFYIRLKRVQEYYRQIPNTLAVPFDPSLYIKEEDSQELSAQFTGEEGYGRYLDLNALYSEYLNLPGVERISYIHYIAKLTELTVDSPAAYQYTSHLCQYLQDFIRRSRPLLNMETLMKQLELEFEQQSKSIEKDPLYCEACQKQFSKETVFEAHKTGKKHLKAMQQPKGDSFKKELFFIQEFCKELTTEREDTLAHLERKQTLTEKELIQGAQEDIVNVVEQVAQEAPKAKDYRNFNPLNLPLGWDGKPIPYWLYKLHGLGIEFSCEICGGFTYMGRQAFEKHFKEWRHSFGLKCLGIINSKSYHDITTIEDARMVAERLKLLEREQDVSDDVTQEYEDEQGNVFNKRTYDDLKRQGLL